MLQKLYGQIEDSEKVEKTRNIRLAKVISLSIGILGLCIMTPVSYKAGNRAMVIGSLIYGSLALCAYIYTSLTNRLHGFNIITVVLTYFLILNFMITGGNEGFGITWVIIFPLLYLYMLKPLLFTILVLGNILIVGLGFFTPLNSYIYQGWNSAFKIRFFLVLFMEGIFATAIKLASSNMDKNRKYLFDNLMDLQKNLQEKIKNSTAALIHERDRSEKFLVELSLSLAGTIDAKDKYTSGHSRRVAEYSREIAKRLGKSEEEQQTIYLVALLHDIGKIGVPDEIINKKSKLTDEEYAIVKKHPEIGSEILKNIESIPEIRTGVRWHHERWDGKGYPDQLTADDIPEYAQIVAVADSYDAMTSNRSYRKLLPQSVVRSEIEKGIGTQFAEKLAKIMLSIIDDDKNYILHE